MAENETKRKSVMELRMSFEQKIKKDVDLKSQTTLKDRENQSMRRHGTKASTEYTTFSNIDLKPPETQSRGFKRPSSAVIRETQEESQTKGPSTPVGRYLNVSNLPRESNTTSLVFDHSIDEGTSSSRSSSSNSVDKKEKIDIAKIVKDFERRASSRPSPIELEHRPYQKPQPSISDFNLPKIQVQDEFSERTKSAGYKRFDLALDGHTRLKISDYENRSKLQSHQLLPREKKHFSTSQTSLRAPDQLDDPEFEGYTQDRIDTYENHNKKGSQQAISSKPNSQVLENQIQNEIKAGPITLTISNEPIDVERSSSPTLLGSRSQNGQVANPSITSEKTHVTKQDLKRYPQIVVKSYEEASLEPVKNQSNEKADSALYSSHTHHVEKMPRESSNIHAPKLLITKPEEPHIQINLSAVGNSDKQADSSQNPSLNYAQAHPQAMSANTNTDNTRPVIKLLPGTPEEVLIEQDLQKESLSQQQQKNFNNFTKTEKDSAVKVRSLEESAGYDDMSRVHIIERPMTSHQKEGRLATDEGAEIIKHKVLSPTDDTKESRTLRVEEQLQNAPVAQPQYNDEKTLDGHHMKQATKALHKKQEEPEEHQWLKPREDDQDPELRQTVRSLHPEVSQKEATRGSNHICSREARSGLPQKETSSDIIQEGDQFEHLVQGNHSTEKLELLEFPSHSSPTTEKGRINWPNDTEIQSLGCLDTISQDRRPMSVAKGMRNNIISNRNNAGEVENISKLHSHRRRTPTVESKNTLSSEVHKTARTESSNHLDGHLIKSTQQELSGQGKSSSADYQTVAQEHPKQNLIKNHSHLSENDSSSHCHYTTVTHEPNLQHEQTLDQSSTPKQISELNKVYVVLNRNTENATNTTISSAAADQANPSIRSREQEQNIKPHSVSRSNNSQSSTSPIALESSKPSLSHNMNMQESTKVGNESAGVETGFVTEGQECKNLQNSKQSPYIEYQHEGIEQERIHSQFTVSNRNRRLYDTEVSETATNDNSIAGELESSQPYVKFDSPKNSIDSNSSQNTNFEVQSAQNQLTPTIAEGCNEEILHSTSIDQPLLASQHQTKANPLKFSLEGNADGLIHSEQKINTFPNDNDESSNNKYCCTIF